MNIGNSMNNNNFKLWGMGMADGELRPEQARQSMRPSSTGGHNVRGSGGRGSGQRDLSSNNPGEMMGGSGGGGGGGLGRGLGGWAWAVLAFFSRLLTRCLGCMRLLTSEEQVQGGTGMVRHC